MQRTLRLLDPLKERYEAELHKISVPILNCIAHPETREGQVQRHPLVLEAAELATDIKESMLIYGFEDSLEPPNGNGVRVITIHDLKNCIVIDSRTGQALYSSANPVTGPGGRVGEVLFCLFPAFVRISADGNKKIVLVKATVVVKFDQPVPRAKKNKSTR